MSFYNSATHGRIPLSFTGKRLMQNLRDAVSNAIAASDFCVDSMALSVARGDIAKYLGELESKTRKVPYGETRYGEPLYGQCPAYAALRMHALSDAELARAASIERSYAPSPAELRGVPPWNFPPPYDAPSHPIVSPAPRKAVCGDIFAALFVYTRSPIARDFLASSRYQPSARAWNRSAYGKRWL